jgi:hypothetical protein
MSLIHQIIQMGDSNVHKIIVPIEKKHTHFRFLLSADWHIDNPDCNDKLFNKIMREAKETKAGILAFGDLFCAMQGKYDKRSSKSKLRPENQVNNYLDSLVEYAYTRIEPYKDNMLLFGYGNHETAIINHHETDLLQRLVTRMDNGTQLGGYGGWVNIQFFSKSTPKNCNTYRIKYFHGSGGGGEVTKGTIQSQRHAVIYPQADLVCTGHVHEQYLITYMCENVSNISGLVALKKQVHVRTPTFKDEYKNGKGGWHVERGGHPKPLGAWWLDLIVSTNDLSIQARIYQAE